MSHCFVLCAFSLNLDPETNPYVPAAHKEYIRRQRLRIIVE